MTIKGIMKQLSGQYDEIEVYRFRFTGKIHTDNLKWLEDYSEDEEIEDYDLMGEEDYDRTILANCGEFFADMYDKDVKILCIFLPVNR